MIRFIGRYAPDRGGPDEPVPLAEILALVFSEIMRDVDLFVGVASVANDLLARLTHVIKRYQLARQIQL